MDQKNAFGQDIVLKVRPPTIDKEVQMLKERARQVLPVPILTIEGFLFVRID